MRFILVAGALAGCQNPCQQLCVRMADYATECDLPVTEADIDACIEDQKDPEDKQVCRDFGNASQIRDEWTCEDLALYF